MHIWELWFLVKKGIDNDTKHMWFSKVKQKKRKMIFWLLNFDNFLLPPSFKWFLIFSFSIFQDHLENVTSCCKRKLSKFSNQNIIIQKRNTEFENKNTKFNHIKIHAKVCHVTNRPLKYEFYLDVKSKGGIWSTKNFS